MCDTLLEKVSERESFSSAKIIPTGIQEDIIQAVAGAGRHQPNPRVVEVITANKVGKTTMLIGGVLKNIFWENDQEYFDYPVFNAWPYPKDGRIVGTAKNVQEGGPIHQEIKKWWPRARYRSYYRGKHYPSYYEIDGKDGLYTFDVMSFDQDKDEFEGPVKGWTLVDEPPPPDLLGPIFSRFYVGGILFLGMTPIESGLVLDTLGDMEQKGAKINRVSATIWDNSITSGKPNSKGTRRGLMTDEQIAEYITTIPEDEKEARLEGKASSKSGKIYPMFDRAVHIRDFDLQSPYMINANHYMVIDPHPKHYPFMQWWAVTADEKFVCYNEWPTWGTLKAYYDEIRLIKPFSMTFEQMSNVIKIQDYSQLGYKILKRAPDPRYVKAADGPAMGKTLGFLEEFAKYDICFDLPAEERISVQRERIRAFLRYERNLPINQFNEPKMFWHPQCRNSIRAMERHSWVEGDKEKESETFKDPVDCTRMFLAMLGNTGYIPKVKEVKRVKADGDERVAKTFLERFPDCGLA